MDWILDNFKLIFLVAGAFAYWYAQRKKERAENDTRDRQEPRRMPAERNSTDDRQEQVRRIQEEIRRKILQRAGLPDPERTSPVAPYAAPPEEPAAPAPPPLPPVRQASRQYWDASETERQRELADRFRALEQQRQSGASRVDTGAGLAPIASQSIAAQAAAENANVRRDLADTLALRRAVILREVLGPPVSLR